MALKFTTHFPPLLLAGGQLLGMAAAHAAGGYIVAPEQEAVVKPGMNTVQVELAIGRPAKNLQFRNEAGPTWTYAVANSQMSVFDVVFGADGTVVSANERLDESGRAHGDRR